MPTSGGGGSSSSSSSGSWRPGSRPGSPGSPTLPLLGTGSGPILARRGLLPYAVGVVAAVFLIANLASHSAAGHLGGGGGGGNGSYPAGPDGTGLMLASSGVNAAMKPSSTVCDCTGKGGDTMEAAIRRQEQGGDGRDGAAAGGRRVGASSKGLRGQGTTLAARSEEGGQQQQQQQQQPPPWLGAGRAPVYKPGKRHVRVVIRVHHLQEAATRSLIWALRGQEQPATGEQDRFTMDFALVATERKGLPVVRRIARDMWAAAAQAGAGASTKSGSQPSASASAGAAGSAVVGGASEGDVLMADTPEPFFLLAANRSAPFRCTAQDRERYKAAGGERYVRLHCAYDNHAYYQATDVAVLDAVRACSWCTHVLVTNSDNGYHPEFLARALAERADLVTTDFIDHGERVVAAEWRWGEVDLGGVLATKAVVARTGGFIASLPPHAGPQETHDNDYWFVHRALELGATTAIVRQFLFFHN